MDFSCGKIKKYIEFNITGIFNIYTLTYSIKYTHNAMELSQQVTKSFQASNKNCIPIKQSFLILLSLFNSKICFLCMDFSILDISSN